MTEHPPTDELDPQPPSKDADTVTTSDVDEVSADEADAPSAVDTGADEDAVTTSDDLSTDTPSAEDVDPADADEPSAVDAGADELTTDSSSAGDADGPAGEPTSADGPADAAPTSEAGTPDGAAPDAEDAHRETDVPGEDAELADVVPGEDAAPQDVVPGEDAEAADGVPADEDHLPPGQTEVPTGDEVVIDDDTMRRALEAILMVTDEPLPVLTLARAVGRPTGEVAAALSGLSAEYTEQGRGFDLREIGGGWRYYTRPEAAAFVERFVLDGQQARLTQAALETLSVVAYKQPVSRARVSAIRGVNVDGVMRTLIARGLVEEAGSDTDSQATLYRTTSYFLERMGMQSLDDLPELAPYLPDMDDIEDELAAQSLPPATEEAAPDGTTPAEPEPEDDNTPLENDLAPEPAAPAPEDDDEDDESEYGETGVDGSVDLTPEDDDESDESEYGATAAGPDDEASTLSDDEAPSTDEPAADSADDSDADGSGDFSAENSGDEVDETDSEESTDETDSDGDGSLGSGDAPSRWYPYDQTAEEIDSAADVPNGDGELRERGE
ncbi:SMC-Scp complex subunit ScpB [Kribbella sp. NPDC051587]|uniref:SMC-Scp complex subunit ScpB n=1 Tax=Kribbella sp. NPDC051587 TaxID=3364119 RepID=UPI0037AAABED